MSIGPTRNSKGTDFHDSDRGLFGSHASRRNFLKTLAAAGAGTIIPGGKLIAQAVSPSVRPLPGRIDVHHHMLPQSGGGKIFPGEKLFGNPVSPSVLPLPGGIDVLLHVFPPFYFKAMESE